MLLERTGTSAQAAQPGVVEARVLGVFEVAVDGSPVAPDAWVRRSAERLVQLLLVTRGHGLAREGAAECLWPEAAPDASRANLRKAIHFARRALGSDGVLATPGDRVCLEPSRLVLDLDRLEAAFDLLSRAGRCAHRADASPGDLEAALGVVLEFGGIDLLPDVYEDWLVGPREHLRSRWQQTALDVARVAQRTGEDDRALTIAGRLIEADPTDEAAHRLAIEVLAAQGRHHAVRRQYDLCRRALRSTLGVEPSAETTEAFRLAEQTAVGKGHPEANLPRLVARDDELRRLEQHMAHVVAGESRALAIHGPTGIGKTRLLRELVGYAHAAGWRVLEWQSVEGTGAPAYGPLRQAHRRAVTADEVADWPEPARSGIASACPSLEIAPAITFASRAALVEGLVLAVERLASSEPLLIAIDDLPWLDDATVELLQHVIARLPDARVLVATTHRDDETLPSTAVRYLEQARRAGGSELILGPLERDDVGSLIVANLGGTSVQPDLARWAFQLSEGNPLFCLELVRAGRDRRRVRLAGDRWTTTAATSDQSPSDVSDTVRRLVAGRTAMLKGAPLELLGMAAELESEFSFGTLQAVLADLPGGLVAALDDVLASGLLVERGAGYAFAHPLYRLAVRGATGFAKRAETRLGIAQALADCRVTGSSADMLRAAAVCPVAAAAAVHALEAVDLGLPAALPLAVALGFTAAERAARLFDSAATSLLERSLTAWARLAPEQSREFAASRAMCSLANLRMRDGDDAAARVAFRDALAAARDPEELSRAYTAFWWLPYRHGDFEGALAILDEAMSRIPQTAPAARAVVETAVGWTLGRLHRMDAAVGHLEHAVTVLAASDDRKGEMTARDQLGMMLHMARRPSDAVGHLERAVAIALELGDIEGEFARIHLGTVLVRSGSAARARPHLERGLEIAHAMGDRYLEAVGAWAAAEMEDAVGDYPAARELRVREIGLLASIGGNPHNEALAHAHLSHLARLSGDPDAADAEAAAARQLAGISDDAGYAARIEEALAAQRWSDLETG